MTNCKTVGCVLREGHANVHTDGNRMWCGFDAAATAGVEAYNNSRGCAGHKKLGIAPKQTCNACHETALGDALSAALRSAGVVD